MLPALPRFILPALLGLTLISPAPVAAQSGNLGLELNSMQDVDGICRATFVATNNTGIGLAALSYEVAIWDRFGTIPLDGLLVFDFGQMPVGKTKVVQFDLPDRTCGDISRVLINDTVECRSAEAEHDFCLTALIANSRGTMPFGQ